MTTLYYKMGGRKNWVDQLLAQGIKAFMCMCNG